MLGWEIVLCESLATSIALTDCCENCENHFHDPLSGITGAVIKAIKIGSLPLRPWFLESANARPLDERWESVLDDKHFLEPIILFKRKANIIIMFYSRSACKILVRFRVIYFWNFGFVLHIWNLKHKKCVAVPVIGDQNFNLMFLILPAACVVWFCAL